MKQQITINDVLKKLDQIISRFDKVIEALQHGDSSSKPKTCGVCKKWKKMWKMPSR